MSRLERSSPMRKTTLLSLAAGTFVASVLGTSLPAAADDYYNYDRSAYAAYCQDPAYRAQYPDFCSQFYSGYGGSYYGGYYPGYYGVGWNWGNNYYYPAYGYGYYGNRYWRGDRWRHN